MSKKIYYGLLAVLVIIALFLNLKSNISGITMMYIHIAEHCSHAKMYELSNFYYTVAQKINKKTVWLDYNIAKNIIESVWDKPLTPYKQAMLQEAINHLDIEIKKYPDNPNINAEYAYAYEHLEDYDKAIDYYKKCVNKVQNWQHGYYKLAYLYSHVKMEYETGLKYVDKALELKPDDMECWVLKGWILTKSKRYREAIDYYKKCVNKVQNWQYGYYKLAYLYSHAKMEYETGLKYVDKALELKPDDMECWFLKGWILKKFKRYREAIACYEKYLNRYPNSVAALVNISNCEIEIKDFNNALKHVNLGLKYNRTSSYLIFNKIEILMSEHKFDEAISESNKMLERDIYSRQNAYAYMYLAEIARYQNKQEEAERFYALSKENAQKYYDKYCNKPYDLDDIDAKCYNTYTFLQDFEKKKTGKLDF